MTSNLIAYWSHQEDKRHNRAVEEETKRANVAREVETVRHNLASEQETFRSNQARELETHRANVAYEIETHRSNLAHELETNRHNIATEYETARHNKEQESIGRSQVSLGYAQLAESIRHNKATEAQTAAYNAAYLEYNYAGLALRRTESDRDYVLGKQKIAQGYGALAETIRHNKATEEISRANQGLNEDKFLADTIYRGSAELREWLKATGAFTLMYGGTKGAPAK